MARIPSEHTTSFTFLPVGREAIPADERYVHLATEIDQVLYQGALVGIVWTCNGALWCCDQSKWLAYNGYKVYRSREEAAQACLPKAARQVVFFTHTTQHGRRLPIHVPAVLLADGGDRMRIEFSQRGKLVRRWVAASQVKARLATEVAA